MTEDAPPDLDDIGAEPVPPDDEDAKAAYQGELEILQQKAKEHGLRNEQLEQSIKMRRLLSGRVFGLVVASLVACFVLVLADGSGCIPLPAPETCSWSPGSLDFDLSDTVMVSVVAAVTIQVIGLLYAVTRSLFPSKG